MRYRQISFAGGNAALARMDRCAVSASRDFGRRPEVGGMVGPVAVDDIPPIRIGAAKKPTLGPETQKKVNMLDMAMFVTMNAGIASIVAGTKLSEDRHEHMALGHVSYGDIAGGALVLTGTALGVEAAELLAAALILEHKALRQKTEQK